MVHWQGEHSVSHAVPVMIILDADPGRNQPLVNLHLVVTCRVAISPTCMSSDHRIANRLGRTRVSITDVTRHHPAMKRDHVV